jgi:hypothetical protein
MADTGATISRKVRTRLCEQRALVLTLLRQREQLAGSVFRRYGQCGKPRCVCRTGQRHGPYYVLSSSAGEFAYLEPAGFAAAKGLIARHREFRRGLRKLKRLNLELVGLLRRHQESLATRGRKRLAATASMSRK